MTYFVVVAREEYKEEEVLLYEGNYSPEERDRNAMNSKRESHAHRYYSHNW